jgi:phage head maturation protease
MNAKDWSAAAFERLARKHYRIWKSGRLFIKSPADIAGAAKPSRENGPVEIRAWATRTTVDLEGDVVLPEGMDSTYFERNRTLFVDHDYSAMSAVGKLRNLIRQPGGIIVESVLIDNPANPLRAQIEALAKQANIGQSVGFEALDYGPPTADERKAFPEARIIHRAWRMLEVSYTAMPMNGDCQSSMTPNAGDAQTRTVVII